MHGYRPIGICPEAGPFLSIACRFHGSIGGGSLKIFIVELPHDRHYLHCLVRASSVVL